MIVPLVRLRVSQRDNDEVEDMMNNKAGAAVVARATSTPRHNYRTRSTQYTKYTSTTLPLKKTKAVDVMYIKYCICADVMSKMIIWPDSTSLNTLLGENIKRY